MVFQERTYSVIIVSASEKFNTGITPLLPVTDFWPVQFVSSVAEAKRRILDREVDIVLINAPLKDDFGMQLAIDVCNQSSAGVLLLAKSEVYEEIYAKALENGVMTLPKPTSPQMLSQCLRGLCAMRERMRMAEQRQSSVENKIKEIRVVNRAKWVLIEQQHMSEAEAHRYLEKQAMDRRCSRREVAESIIEDYGTTQDARA